MPTFEADAGKEFSFFLAEKLHMTVADMEARMSNREFVYWTIYHGRRVQEQEMANG